MTATTESDTLRLDRPEGLPDAAWNNLRARLAQRIEWAVQGCQCPVWCEESLDHGFDLDHPTDGFYKHTCSWSTEDYDVQAVYCQQASGEPALDSSVVHVQVASGAWGVGAARDLAAALIEAANLLEVGRR